MQGRSLAIVIAGMLAIGAYIQSNMLQSNKKLTENILNYTSRQTAQNIAQTGVYMGLRQLAQNQAWRAGFTNLPLMGGKVTVRILDTTFMGRSAIGIRATATVPYGSYSAAKGGVSDTTGYCLAFLPKGFIPATVKAAITTNNPIKTLGGLTVDGRDHDFNGNYIPNSGTLGIWTTKTYLQSGSSKTGGTNISTGIDYLPAKPANATTIATNQVWPGGYPGSPDSILGGPAMGFPEGTLKAIAKSGINGSQYTTDPSTLTFPLRGVTYVELASGGTWIGNPLNGTGVLIVHNSNKNAVLKNFNPSTSVFKGLMIIDDPVHIHSVVIGALIGLTPSPSEGNCIGNGNGWVLFSNEAISTATGQLLGSVAGGCDANVFAWWE